MDDIGVVNLTQRGQRYRRLWSSEKGNAHVCNDLQTPSCLCVQGLSVVSVILGVCQDVSMLVTDKYMYVCKLFYIDTCTRYMNIKI